MSAEGDTAGSDAFRARLVGAGLAARADGIVALDRHTVQLRSDPEIGPPQVGVSRLGGEPDLPASAPWPEWRGTPLSFVAQIALGEMPRVPDQRLPEAGLLSFFTDPLQRAWGFDPADRGSWCVRWTAPDEALARRAIPRGVPPSARFGARRLTGTTVVTHVPAESAELERLGLWPGEGQEDWFRYGGVVLDRPPVPNHRLLGHPDPIQGDMQHECQLASHGVYCGGRAERPPELRAGAVDWRLLLQVDTDDDAGMMWGDCGRLFFWMPRDALDQRDWSSAWMVLQSS